MHEAVDVGGPGRLEDLLLGGVGAAVGDVVADGAAEEPGVLQHHPEVLAQGAAGDLRDVAAVEGDAAAVELVEPHDEVHERRLAGARRPDDGDGLPGLGHERQVLDERPVRVVGERHVLEGHPTLDRGHAARCRPGRAICSSVSSRSSTRSSEAMPDWKTFIIDASCVSGMEKVREYWMKACTSPTEMAPRGHAHPADDRDEHVLHVAEEHRQRLHEARHELGAVAGLVERVVGGAEPLLHLVLAPERLHDGVAGEGLLDLGVEDARCCPTG